jgi:hypothetical protein
VKYLISIVIIWNCTGVKWMKGREDRDRSCSEHSLLMHSSICPNRAGRLYRPGKLHHSKNIFVLQARSDNPRKELQKIGLLDKGFTVPLFFNFFFNFFSKIRIKNSKKKHSKNTQKTSRETPYCIFEYVDSKSLFSSQIYLEI